VGTAAPAAHTPEATGCFAAILAAPAAQQHHHLSAVKTTRQPTQQESIAPRQLAARTQLLLNHTPQLCMACWCYSPLKAHQHSSHTAPSLWSWRTC
jgi:hypothetical protein